MIELLVVKRAHDVGREFGLFLSFWLNRSFVASFGGSQEWPRGGQRHILCK